jgi:hypothetical protein
MVSVLLTPSMFIGENLVPFGLANDSSLGVASSLEVLLGELVLC